MLTATQLLYEAASRPELPDLERISGRCFLCGGTMECGRPAVLPKTFMDYDKARCPEATHICAACWFSMDDRNGPLTECTGKDKPQRMRNYSHFVLRGEWLPMSKGDKRGMYAVLLQGPELAVIAVSGQKHLIFRAQPGRWQVEEQSMVPDVAGLEALMAPLQALYDGGFGKSEIESGRYSLHRILSFGDDRWHVLEAALRPARGSALFELAVFLLQKSEEKDGESEDAGDGDGTGLGAVAVDGPELQAPLRAGDLGPVSGPAAGRGDGDQQPGDVHQLGLF